MKLSTKIFVLISLPLAFQLVLSFVLFEQLRESEAKFEKEFHRIRVIAELDQVYRLHVRSLAAAAFYSMSKDESVGEKHLASLKELAGALKQLKALTQDDPGLSEETTKLQQAVLAVVPYEMMMRKVSLMESKLNLPASTMARQLIKESMQTIESYQVSLIPVVNEIETFKRSAFELEMVLAAGMALILLGSFLVLYWSQKYVLSVIAVLTDHIKKFKNGDSPHPVIKTKDEIAELETVLCESANRIITLETLRRELCSIVSHDIRAPMTSIGGLVTLLEEGVLGKLSEEHELLNKKLKASCADLLNVLNNILDLDKLRSDKWTISIQSASTDEVCQRIEKELRSADFANVTTAVQPGTFECDMEAIARTFVAIAQVFAVPSSQIKIECTALGECKMVVPSAAAGSGSDVKVSSALSLAHLFCEKQKAQLTHTTLPESSVFSIRVEHKADSNDKSSERTEDQAYNAARSSTKRISKIGRSLLFLIGRPLAVSFAAIVLLGMLLTDIGQELRREIISREIVHSTTNLTSDITHLMLISIRRTASNSEGEEQAQKRIATKIDSDMQALRDLETQTHSSMSEELELVQQKVDNAKALSKELTGKPLDQVPGTLKEHLEVGDLTSIAFSKAGSLFTNRIELDSNETLLLSKLRNTELLVIIGALALSAILTIFGAIQVSRGLLARINNVAENARRLTQRKSLRKPIDGKDEIADLDSFFFESAEKIAQLERERKELTALLREQLKAPLLFLQDGFSTILSESENLTDKGKTLIQRTVVEIRRLNDLADDLLILDSIETTGRVTLETEIADVNINDIVSRSIHAVAPMAQLKQVDIAYGADHNHTVRADVSRSIQILVNLLSNAVKFSPEKSSVTVTSETDQNTVKIIVSDNGRGIPANEIDKVFSRFDQVSKDDNRKGSGLGLFISKKLAESQSGDVGFESTEGVGSKFWLALPLARDN